MTRLFVLLMLAAICLPAGELLRYRLTIPEPYDPQQTYPLVIWLHDILGVGNDNRRQTEGTNAAGARLWSSPENQAHHPTFVLAPQCPFGSLWVNLLTRTPSRKLRVAVELTDDLQRQYSIDPDRVYLVGQSMGGFAVWALLAAYPHRFAAAVPVSGGGKTSSAHRFSKVPLWVFHGRLDPVVPVHESRRMIEALRNAGGDPRYSELIWRAHDNMFWEDAFAEPGLADWLFAQRRSR